MRYFFHIGYNGFNYHGWQRHAPHLTVQEVLEENISKLIKEPTTILGCGRTDAQVHARQYFFHLDTDKEINEQTLFRLNKILPEDIAVFDIIPVESNAHAQYSATQRTYEYFIHTYKDPFLNRFSCYYQGKPLDIQKVKEALTLLPKYSDYYSFCKSPEKQEHTLCQVMAAELLTEGNKLCVRITANRFLRGMIRALVARLFKVGTGEISLQAFEQLLASIDSESTVEFAPPQGLYLSKVTYPFLNIPARSDFSPFTQRGTEKEWQLA